MHFLKAKGVEDVTLSLFYLSAVFSIWIKEITVIIRRKIILNSKDILSNAVCQPRDTHESEILYKYLHIIR